MLTAPGTVLGASNAHRRTASDSVVSTELPRDFKEEMTGLCHVFCNCQTGTATPAWLTLIWCLPRGALSEALCLRPFI